MLAETMQSAFMNTRILPNISFSIISLVPVIPDQLSCLVRLLTSIYLALISSFNLLLMHKKVLNFVFVPHMIVLNLQFNLLHHKFLFGF